MIHRVGALEHATYDSWELSIDSSYATEAAALKKEWIERCAKLKGTNDSSLGGVKNFVFLGLLNAVLQDTVIEEDKRTKIKDIALRLSGDGKGTIDQKKVRELHGW